MDLFDASCIVTGGASGLGEATAEMLCSRGARVVIIDVDSIRGVVTAKRIGAQFARADVSDTDEVAASISLAKSLGPLRVLVNCAGITRGGRMVSSDGLPFDLAQFREVVNVNLVGTFNCARLAAAAMAVTPVLDSGDRGVIVNTASAAAHEGQIGQVAYTASKGAIVAMTLVLARDLAQHGIRVNTISPGMFETPIFEKLADPVSVKQNLTAEIVHPARLGRPEEYAAMVSAIIDNDYLNGEVIRLD